MRRRPLLAGLLAGILVLPSCFTTALWFARDGDDGWTGSQILGRVLLTPFALVLDGVTICAQEALFGDDDDGDCGGDGWHRSHHR